VTGPLTIPAQRRSLFLTALVLVLAAGFIRLGFWQIDRHQQRVESNETALTRLGQPALTDLGSAGEESRYRMARITGTFDADQELLIRSQVYRGSAGFHVITPLVLSDGSAVLVNRGWVPLVLDTVPVAEAPPPVGETLVEGWVELSRQRPPLGPTDPLEGRLEVMSRVDVPRIQQQMGVPVAPVYLVMVGPGGALPEPLGVPSFDEGPHLGYAIQWFGFAGIVLIGYFFLVRKRQKARPSTTS
jgi:surfeit locus 1 family protein